MKRHYLILLITGMLMITSCSKNNPEAPILEKEYSEIERVEPPNWWIGFENKNLQLLVKHPNIGEAKASISYPGVLIAKQHKAKSPNYLFLDLEIADNTPAGKFNISFQLKDGSNLNQSYELKI